MTRIYLRGQEAWPDLQLKEEYMEDDKRFKYDDDTKIEVAEFFSQNGKKATIEKYPHIPYSTMYSWYKNLATAAPPPPPPAQTRPSKATRYSYTDEEREEIAAYGEEHGVTEAFREYGVTKKTVRKWMADRQEALAKEQKKQNRKKKASAKKTEKEPAYSRVVIDQKKPEPEAKDKSKIYVVYSDNADAIIDVLKGLK